MVSTPEAVALFDQIMQFTRQPVVSEPNKLTVVERYLLIDAYQFLKTSALFPQEISDITELEIWFLKLAYEHYKYTQGMDINDKAFEESMRQLSAIDRGVSDV